MQDKKIGVVAATALSITVVVGAGLLALPGLSYQMAGRLGYVPWILVAVLMVPLLSIFSYFASKNPTAGGAIGYIRETLGPKPGAMAEMIVLGTFTLGIPAIALIGAEYLRQSIHGITVFQAGILTVTIAYGAAIVGLKISGFIQTGIAAFIVIGLTAITVYFLLNSDPPIQDPSKKFDLSDYSGVVSSIPIVLFSYTGWEMTAFLAEDMKNPKRDMPISLWISFFIVVVMYVFIAWTIATFATDEDGWKLAPFIQLAKKSIGEFGGVLVGVIASMLVIANVIAAFISASRAIYSAGRDGMLPKIIGTTNAKGQPMIAVTITWAVFVTIIIMTQILSAGTDTLLQLAGQNFFVLYLMCTIGYTRLFFGGNFRFFIGLFATLCVLAMLTLFSLPGILYCLALSATGFLLSLKKYSM